MKFLKRKNIFPISLVAMLVVGAAKVTADRIVTVYGSGKALFTTNVENVDSITYGTTGQLFKVYNPSRTQIFFTTRAKVDSIVFSGSYDKSSYPEINLNGFINNMTVNYNDSSKEYTLSTTGGDPYLFTTTLTSNLPNDSCILSFEYRCPKGINDLQIFFADPVSEARSVKPGKVPATIGTEWATYRYYIGKYRKDLNWGKKGDRLRIDFGTTSGVDISLRHLRILTATEEEQSQIEKADSVEKAKTVTAENITAYLNNTYASTVDSVSVTIDSVIVRGTCNGEGKFALADVAPYEDVTETKNFENLTEIGEAGSFEIRLPRKLYRNKFYYDRVLSKWAVVKVDGEQNILDSHARYADDVYASYSAEPGVLKGKKGIAAGGGTTYIADFDSLDAHSITMNLVLSSFISTKSRSDLSAYRYGGKLYYINNSAISGIDNLLKAAQKRDIIVEAILLTPSESEFRDPECTGGYYTMPNMTTASAVNFYAAALNYLAERYSSGAYGRIHHWIMHNEVDQGDTWTNMGDQPEMRYYDRYMKSMRMCYNIVRQYDQNASILGSYTHSWNLSGTDYAPRKMLEQNVQYSATEGDFRWGVAFHPYPINLTRPEFWNNDKSEATFSNNTQYVTFYNPEVINAWILDKAHYYKDGTKRLLFFSEQGTNSPSYSESDLAKQAAGAAWMWKKLEKLDGIDAMQWHNWADNREEFGLRIGLRAFAEGNFKELDPKPVWYVWQAAGTDREEEVFAPYLNVIGITSWDGIVKTVK